MSRGARYPLKIGINVDYRYSHYPLIIKDGYFIIGERVMKYNKEGGVQT